MIIKAFGAFAAVVGPWSVAEHVRTSKENTLVREVICYGF